MGRNAFQLCGQEALDFAPLLSTYQLGDSARFQLCSAVSRSGKHYFLTDVVRVKAGGSALVSSGLSCFPRHRGLKSGRVSNQWAFHRTLFPLDRNIQGLTLFSEDSVF